MAARPSTDEAPPARVSLTGLREARHLYGYLWPYRSKLVCAMAALLLAAGLGLLFPVVTGALVDQALGRGAVELPAGWPADIDGLAISLLLILAVQAVFGF